MDFFIENINPSSNSRQQEPAQPLITPQKLETYNRLYFHKTGNCKYKLTVEAEMRLNAALIKTVIEMYWLLQVEQIGDNYCVIDLISYSPSLIACNNDGFREMYHVTRQFQKLYDEIKVIVDSNGDLHSVKNADGLSNRWKAIKNETIQYFNEGTNLEEYFAVNENSFSDADFLKKMVAEVEFFFVYLKCAGYGYEFNTFKEHIRPNAFRTGEIKWDLNFNDYKTTDVGILGSQKVNSRFIPNKAWTERAYGTMPFLNVNELQPKFELEGNYTFLTQTGFLATGNLTVSEIVDPAFLYHKMKYIIENVD